MERTRLVKAKDRVKSWINPKSFDVSSLRNLLIGNMINSTVGEFCAYRLMLKDIRGGELPSYVPDILIITMSTLEALVAPFLSWLGFRKRRSVFVIYTLIVVLSSISMYFIPSVTERQESEFCNVENSNNDTSYQGMSARSIVRLTLIITVALAFQLSRVTSWTHGLAYCEEYAPEKISVHYGAVVLVRVIVLILGNNLVAGLIDNLAPVQISLLVIGCSINLVSFICVVPKHAPKVNGVQKTELPLEGRGFTLSMSRVVSRALVLAMALAASLLAAALWGFGYNQEEIAKVKFLIPPRKSVSFDVILQHYYIIMPIALAGIKFSAPILKDYCRKKALRQTVIMTSFALIFFVLLTVVPKCDQGSVAGLGDSYYNHPECSLSCGCKPKWMEFNPVCVTDNMTTYLSPCHAGCSGTENINGVQVYTRCDCAMTAGKVRRAADALPGACTTECTPQYHLHKMLFIVATTFTILAFQAQGVLILKVVDPRDKSVAMGLLLSMAAMVTFVCGHLTFLAIRVATCRWHEGGQCHLQNTLFPYVVGFCSSFLVLLSAVISIVCFALTRVYEKKYISDTRL